MKQPRLLQNQVGFTLSEMLIAVAIMVAVTAAIFSLIDPAHGTFAAQPELSDMQQRIRVGVDALHKDLLMAGAGMSSGSAAGSLVSYFAPLMPYRVGGNSADPAGSFETRAMSVLYVPATASQTTIRDPMASHSGLVTVNLPPGCPVGDDSCGFREGMSVLIFDDAGAFDVFKLRARRGSTFQVRPRSGSSSKIYRAGSYAAEVIARTYWLKATASDETHQLMRYDGFESDVPVIDNVIGLRFEYFGEPQPAVLRPLQRPRTTYGPAPPNPSFDNPSDSWGAGENCIFTMVDGRQVPRMDALGAAGGPLVELEEAKLIDGPWCPDATAPERYDADVLRIRMVRVTMRVRAGSRAFRAAAPLLLGGPGVRNAAGHFIPDQEIVFDVVPRNMNFGR